ncbi:GIY-YIG nuclease family protein [Ferrimonas futtsuensis]|uniref:GIY-YIG nuclease family protein n=1 Tax=Ferrimonas futtsuensis TaxID=364764 RepID=UPI0004256F98|nr:GIY-YIG nuclease family protein [Ferrimonas futtsuensis]
MWSLYLVRTACDRLYTGITTDVERRFQQHSSGRGAKALKGKGPLTLEFHTPIGDRSLASKVEYRVKQLSRAQKERVLSQKALPEHCLDVL